jgi:transposase
MEAIANKVRELVLECYANGLGTTEIAGRFKVTCDWARRVRRRWLLHELRTVIQQKHGPEPMMDTARRLQLAQLVEQTPDATLEELKKQLTFPVSVTTIFRTLNDMKLTLKKVRACQRTRAARREASA